MKRAFVLAEYFGYLRRDPDSDLSGYDNRLQKLESHGGNFVAAVVVKSFFVSTECRRRFGPE